MTSTGAVVASHPLVACVCPTPLAEQMNTLSAGPNTVEKVMTYKIFGMLKRPDEMTFQQFKTWWVEVHVPRVLKWPGIVAYEINFSLNENEPFDGVAAVSFNSREAAEKVFQTPEGNSARSAAIAETSRNVIFLAEEVVIVTRPIGHQG